MLKISGLYAKFQYGINDAMFLVFICLDIHLIILLLFRVNSSEIFEDYYDHANLLPNWNLICRNFFQKLIQPFKKLYSPFILSIFRPLPMYWNSITVNNNYHIFHYYLAVNEFKCIFAWLLFSKGKDKWRLILANLKYNFQFSGCLPTPETPRREM